MDEDVEELLSSISPWPEQNRVDVGRVRGFTIGIVGQGKGHYGVSAATRTYSLLAKRLVELGRELHISYTSIQVDVDLVHDIPVVTNRGPCVFVSFGRYTGGELQVADMFHVTCHGGPVYYESSVRHGHCCFRGRKFGVAYFYHPHAYEAEDIDVIWELGMNRAVDTPSKGPSFQTRIEIASRDLGMFNTFVDCNGVVMELPYKRQGIWALRVQEGGICEQVLIDSYFNQEFNLQPWESTIYTVSDTACAVSRPLPYCFYESFLARFGIRVPKIEYRMPFVVFASDRWPCMVFVGDRRSPFIVTVSLYQGRVEGSASRPTYSTKQNVDFD